MIPLISNIPLIRNCFKTCPNTLKHPFRIKIKQILIVEDVVKKIILVACVLIALRVIWNIPFSAAFLSMPVVSLIIMSTLNIVLIYRVTMAAAMAVKAARLEKK